MSVVIAIHRRVEEPKNKSSSYFATQAYRTIFTMLAIKTNEAGENPKNGVFCEELFVQSG